MTKKEMFEKIAVAMVNDAEVVSFCEHEIELLSRKSGSKSLTKTQKANVAVKEAIKEALGILGTAVTVSDLIASSEALAGLTNQKVSALLRQMVEAKEVVKTIEGKKSYFALA